MMIIDTTILLEILRIGAFSFLLWILIFWLVPDYRIDAVRQRLFVVRDRLFEQAAAGVIPFDHPAYTMLREHINGFIRTAHRVNLLLVIGSLLFPWFRRNLRATNFFKMLETSSVDLPNEAKMYIADSYREVTGIMLSYVIFGLDRVLLYNIRKRGSKSEFPRTEQQAIRIIEGEVCSLEVVERGARRRETNLASGMGY